MHIYMRRAFEVKEIIIFTALLLAPLAALPAADVPAKKPNIIFILADDLGWADTTLNGHTTFYRTPNLERLAKRGMTFSHAYAASPLCSPTRSAIRPRDGLPSATLSSPPQPGTRNGSFPPGATTTSFPCSTSAGKASAIGKLRPSCQDFR